MAEKKVTLKDIAKEAGVSTATVSYVLSYSEKEKISHETRLKIFEAAQRLNYVPNMNARTLASKKSFLVGIIISMEEHNKKSKVYEYYSLANELQRLLYPRGYDAIFLPTRRIENDISIGQRRSLDAVFIVDVDTNSFQSIANQFYVPAIFIDGYVEDPLFCKIVADYNAVLDAVGATDFYVVLEDYSNKAALEAVKTRVPEKDIFINQYGSDLPQFLQKHTGQKGLVFGEMLGMQAENYANSQELFVVVSSGKDSMLLTDTKRIVVSSRAKAEKAVEVMEGLLDLTKASEVPRVSLIRPEICFPGSM